jgi:hypothetical protein
MSLWSATACDALSGSGSGPGLGSRSGTAEISGTVLYVGERALRAHSAKKGLKSSIRYYAKKFGTRECDPWGAFCLSVSH